MQKKPLIIGISMTVLLATGIIGGQMRTYSEQEVLRECGKGDSCCVATYYALKNLETAWTANMENMKKQEKPASEMIADGIESLRTYNCWAEYVCRAVQFSGHNTPNKTMVNGLTEKQIGVIPGCQAPEDLELSTTWSKFAEFMEENWKFIADTAMSAKDASLQIDMTMPENFFVRNKIGFFPQCMSDVTQKNKYPKLEIANRNYQTCMAMLEEQFGCEDEETCTSPETALVKLQKTLVDAHAKQKASAVENKLSGIMNRMLGLESHVEYVKTKLQVIDAKYPCYPAKCN